jgi:hypothetical protein
MKLKALFRKGKAHTRSRQRVAATSRSSLRRASDTVLHRQSCWCRAVRASVGLRAASGVCCSRACARRLSTFC